MALLETSDVMFLTLRIRVRALGGAGRGAPISLGGAGRGALVSAPQRPCQP